MQTENGVIQRHNAIGMPTPCDSMPAANSSYASTQAAWLQLGNTRPAVPVSSPPENISVDASQNARGRHIDEDAAGAQRVVRRHRRRAAGAAQAANRELKHDLFQKRKREEPGGCPGAAGCAADLNVLA